MAYAGQSILRIDLPAALNGAFHRSLERLMVKATIPWVFAVQVGFKSWVGDSLKARATGLNRGFTSGPPLDGTVLHTVTMDNRASTVFTVLNAGSLDLLVSED